MQPVTLFYLTGCPYCVKAKRALEELKEENAAYGEVPLTWIEESREPELAGRYDYYYVPSLFLGEKKLYEASQTGSRKILRLFFCVYLEESLEKRLKKWEKALAKRA